MGVIAGNFGLAAIFGIAVWLFMRPPADDPICPHSLLLDRMLAQVLELQRELTFHNLGTDFTVFCGVANGIIQCRLRGHG